MVLYAKYLHLSYFYITFAITKGIIMKAILGQYHYAPHRNLWGVWVWDYVSETGATGTFVKDFHTKEEAREYVWEMNGWGKPSKKLN